MIEFPDHVHGSQAVMPGRTMDGPFLSTASSSSTRFSGGCHLFQIDMCEFLRDLDFGVDRDGLFPLTRNSNRSGSSISLAISALPVHRGQFFDPFDELQLFGRGLV